MPLSDCCNLESSETMEKHHYYEVLVPVITCAGCELIYTDYRTEEIIEKHVKTENNLTF